MIETRQGMSYDESRTIEIIEGMSRNDEVAEIEKALKLSGVPLSQELARAIQDAYARILNKRLIRLITREQPDTRRFD